MSVRPALSHEEVERLGDEIAELCAHLDAATYRLLIRLREFDRAEAWGRGFVTCAHWLSWRTGLALGAAREKVRVARALESLPVISEKMRVGSLSYSKVKALTRVATPENEAALLEFAAQGSVGRVEQLVRAWRTCDRNEEGDRERTRHAARFLSVVPDGAGMYDVRGKLDPEVAAVLKRALEAAAWVLYRREGDVADGTPAGARRADAIGLVAECALREALGEKDEAPESTAVSVSTTGRSDRYTVVIHTDATALTEDGEGNAVLEDGTRVSYETSRRLACDAGHVEMTHAENGSPLDVSRKKRIVPPSLRRALEHRDGGCRFPGCGSRFCDAHHVRHWADGGETTMDNLVMLCRRHHRAVHEDGFGVEMVWGVPAFRDPRGQPIAEVPDARAVLGDPIEAMVSVHSAQGVDPGPWTAAPRSTERAFDLGWAILALRPGDLGAETLPAGVGGGSS